MSKNNYITIVPKQNTSDFISDILKAEHIRLIDQSYLEELKTPYEIRAAYYLRVSTGGQATEDKVSLQQQEVQIKEFIQRNNWTIYGMYKDAGISGKNMENRDDFLKAIGDAKLHKFDVLVGWSTDRIARNVEEMTALRAVLKTCNVQITTVKEPTEIVDPRHFVLKENDGLKKFMAYALDWKAEQDNVSRTNRFNLGKIGKAKKGKIPVKVPYGYRKSIYFENGDPKKKIENDIIVDEEAIVVKEIYNLYDYKSWGIRKIAEHLNLKGKPSPRGNKWCYSTVKYTLQNPTYTGLVRYGWRLSKSKESRARLQQGHEGIIVNGNHEHIIEPEQYQRVQNKMGIRKKLGGKAVSSKGLLTGILKCGRCGGGTYITSFPNWYAYKKTPEERLNHKESMIYLCSKYAAYGRSGCSKRYVISAEKIHKIVVEKIMELANSEDARQEFTQQMKKNNTKALKSKLKNLENALKTLEEKNKRIKIAYTNGAISLQEFSDDRKKFEEEKKLLLDEVEETNINLIKEEKIAQQSESALFALVDFQKSWSIADFSAKKELLQILLEKIVVIDNDIQIDFVRK